MISEYEFQDSDNTGTSEFTPLPTYTITFNSITLPIIKAKVTFNYEDLNIREVLSENSIKSQA